MNRSFLLLQLFFITAVPSFSRVIEVPSAGISSIKKAIAFSAPMDTILVKDGNYKEGEVLVDKALTIIGVDNPVVDGLSAGNVFTVRSSHVEISGFTIINSGRSSVRDYAGIKMEKSSHSIVKNNDIINCYFGVYLQGSDTCVIAGNEIKGNGVSESSCGNGIHLWKCKGASIYGNSVEQHRDGIYFEFAQECHISENVSVANLRYGLHFMFSNGNIYRKNTFRKNGSGVAVMYTENVQMIGNTFEDNWGVASYGLLLKDISRSTITENKFLRNTVGIYMEGSSSLVLSKNLFESNGWGMKMLGNCLRDSVINNDFLNNTFDMVTNSFVTDDGNVVKNNFWDRYDGYDLNKDHVGDIPFRPVSLFSVYVEKIPDSIVLIRSFLINLLDSIERAIPSITTDALTDDQPLTRKNI